MRYEMTQQHMLFRDSCADPNAPQTFVGSMSERLAPTASAGRAHRSQFGGLLPSRTVFALANMSLKETCGFCGSEVHPPDYVLPDYEELRAFCNQDSADRRFRMYLEEGRE